MSKRTVEALLSRGFPEDLAKRLSDGHTLSSLQQMNEKQLQKLHIPYDIVINLNGKRPPIPTVVVNTILFKSKCTCCVCRVQNKPYIIHHIVPWDKSKSHEEDNLVVLCLDHHGEAHTKREISLNLTADRLKFLRDEWYALNSKQDHTATYEMISSSENACWDYFNVPRIFEIILNQNINLKEIKNFKLLYDKKYIDEYGYLESTDLCDHTNMYWLDFYGGFYITSYMADVLLELTKYIYFHQLNKIWSKNQIITHIQVGSFIALQGAFYFKRQTKKDRGPAQICRGYRKYRNILLEFDFDAWFSCSCTSYACNLAGHTVKNIFGIVQNITNSNNTLVIKCRVLAIGSFFALIDGGRGSFYNFNYEDDQY